MSLLHFRPINGRAEEIIEAAISQPELAAWPKMQFTFRLVIEEIVVNVVNYAYPEGIEGYLDIAIETVGEGEGDTVTITFTDSGTPFNPLAKEDPDTSLALKDRPIGGLGILLVKKMMDDVTYTFDRGCNILKLTKRMAE